MKIIYLIDTSILLNILAVQNCDQDTARVLDEYDTYTELGCTFILPMATIIETGNHIAQNGDGSTRRKTAQIFVDMIKDAFSGAAPFQISELPSSYEILTWLDDFPNHAGRNKSPSKTTEGTSFGDLSIIKEFEKCCGRFAMSEVRIWSLDSDLQQYHQHGR